MKSQAKASSSGGLLLVLGSGSLVEKKSSNGMFLCAWTPAGGTGYPVAALPVCPGCRGHRGYRAGEAGHSFFHPLHSFRAEDTGAGEPGR